MHPPPTLSATVHMHTSLSHLLTDPHSEAQLIIGLAALLCWGG